MAMQHVQDLVARAYYRHGLFCSSHPLAIILTVGAVICLCASPMVKMPIASNAPHVYKTPAEGFSIPQHPQDTLVPEDDSNDDPQVKPRWFVGAPFAFIQQFVVRAKVSPWHGDLTAEDAFRAPLSRAFNLVSDISKFQDKSGMAIQSFCLYVLDVNDPSEFSGVLPEHGCLIVSPAALWKNDMKVFSEDEDLVETIYSHLKKKSSETTNIKDVLFGIPGKFSGIHRFYIRSRQRLITYAVTLVLKSYNESFILDLKAHLHQKFGSELLNNPEPPKIKHLYFKEQRNIVEVSPLIFVYCLLFLYIYFSVSKIEMVKSKWGLAFSAVFQVISSLAMSVGICLFFGLTPTLHGGEIFPYLVIILGLENILVLTKSVVSTPVHLEVKKRIAQGLEKESWSITKNLLTELLIILMGYFTFVPAIQEFCVFAVVGLLTDFFLQMFFFVTVLSIDIRRMELSDLHKSSIQDQLHAPSAAMTPRSISRTMSVPDSINMMSPTKQRMLQARLPPATPLFRKVPKRLRLVYFWASTRVVQRLIMVSTVLWIIFTSLFVYKSGLVDHLTENHTNDTLRQNASPLKGDVESSAQKSNQEILRHDGQVALKGTLDRKDISLGKSHEGSQTQGLFLRDYYDDLSPLHWPTLFGFYNRTLRGRYISLLPPYHLFINIDPKEAIAMRSDGYEHLSDGIQTPDIDQDYLTDYQVNARAYKLLQESKWDYYVTMSLGVASGASLVILILLLCKCVSLKRLRRQRYKKCRHDDIIRSVQNANESVPLVLRGHKQDVECIVSEAGWIFSSCLSGEIRRWDPATGDCMLVIERKSKPKDRVGSTCPCYNDYQDKPYQTPSLSSTRIPRKRIPSAPDMQTSLGPTWKDVLDNQPDLTDSIQTNFGESSKSEDPVNQSSELASQYRDAKSHHCPSATGHPSTGGDASSQYSSSGGYSFNQRFHSYYESHPTRPKHMASKGFPQQHNMPSSIYGTYASQQPQTNPGFVPGHSRSRSTGVLKIDTFSQPLRSPQNVRFMDQEKEHEHFSERGGCGGPLALQEVPPLWCLACNDTVIAAGCGNGRVEIWDAGNGTLLCYFESSSSGVSAMCIYANMLVVARLDGTLDFLHLVNSNSTYVQDFTDSYENLGSFNRHFIENEYFSGSWECHRVCQMRAHQQLINEVVILNGQVVTASDDHTLKVFRLEDCLYLSTLRGHTGAVTMVTVDKTCSHTIASGSADGTVRVWDLLKCDPIYVLNGHVSSVLSVCCSDDYIVSIGSDDKLCVWKKTTRGRLIHMIQLDTGCGSSVITLADKIMVTGGKGCLVVWDVLSGEPLRKVDLGGTYLPVSQIIAIDHSSIVCDCGEELMVITFPSQLRKDE
ncbi:sterol regulatory element-binding protein cleavage-activating protein-like isoform X2 [Anneissia japonica]|nr:sterol regulatory element-binding protein cleavage-activating protein-like isoform X2 [Anneissia japonica]